MPESGEPLFVRTDRWREGKWLDLWSVVHFLSGISVGLGFAILGFPTWPAIVIAFLTFTMYEMWEALAKIHEAPQNRAMDVVVGMVSFLPAFLLMAPEFYFDQLLVAFFLIFSINIALSVLGWQASQKAAELEVRMRARYQTERARIVRQSVRLRQKLKPQKSREL